MDRLECLRVLAGLRQDQLVFCHLGVTSSEWLYLSPGDHTFYMKSALGLVGSISLGFTAARPNRRVWALEGDGGLCVNFGSLLTIASVQPRNLTYFLLSNRIYESTGGQTMINHDLTDYELMARGAGVRNAFTFHDVDTFARDIPAIISSGQFAFVVLEIERSKQKVSVSPTEPVENTYRFGRYVEQTEGVTIFHRE